jgi:hypothetical protein
MLEDRDAARVRRIALPRELGDPQSLAVARQGSPASLRRMHDPGELAHVRGRHVIRVQRAASRAADVVGMVVEHVEIRRIGAREWRQIAAQAEQLAGEQRRHHALAAGWVSVGRHPTADDDVG